MVKLDSATSTNMDTDTGMHTRLESPSSISNPVNEILNDMDGSDDDADEERDVRKASEGIINVMQTPRKQEPMNYRKKEDKRLEGQDLGGSIDSTSSKKGVQFIVDSDSDPDPSAIVKDTPKGIEKNNMIDPNKFDKGDNIIGMVIDTNAGPPVPVLKDHDSTAFI